MFQYYFKYRDTVSYRDIFGSDTQYYYLVVSHIPSDYYNYYVITDDIHTVSGLK